MAEFCKQCAEELDFPADFTDLFKEKDMKPDGVVGFYCLCETCGPECFVIDDEGTCASSHCNGNLDSNGVPHGHRS
jgi:hypothetical protein